MKLRPTFLALALAASSLAWGEPLDPPERVARLSYVEGALSFQPASEPESAALPDRPLVPGDRIATQGDSRAELALGTAVIRLDQRSELSIESLDAAVVRVGLTAGAASLHLRELYEGENFAVATPNVTIALLAPGEYRVDVDPYGATSFTVRSGAAEVATAGGPVRVADGQRVLLEGGAAYATLVSLGPADTFDDWVLERELQFAQAEPPAGEFYDGYGDEALSEYGEWYDDPGYGQVWMPSYAYGGYDPFYYGSWQHVGFGYAWIDPMPWSYYTYHNGHWAYLRHLDRWCWVPPRPVHHGHFAKDTRPFGHPWNLGRNDRREARLGDSAGKADEPESLGKSRGTPRRLTTDRPVVSGGDMGSVKKSSGGTMVRSLGGDSGGSMHSAAAAKSEGRSPKSTRSSNGSNDRSSSESSSLSPKSSRDLGPRSLP